LFKYRVINYYIIIVLSSLVKILWISSGASKHSFVHASIKSLGFSRTWQNTKV